MSENKQIVAAVGLLIVSLLIFFSVTNTNGQGKTFDSGNPQATTQDDKSSSEQTTKSSVKNSTEQSTEKATKESSKKSTKQSTKEASKGSTAQSTRKETTDTTVEKKEAQLKSAKVQISTSTTALSERPKDLPKVSKNDWNLVLVGPNNKLKTEIKESQLVALSNGFEVDKRIAKSFEDLSAAAKKAGYPLVTISAFRSVAYQEEVFSEGVTQNMSRLGLSEEEATKEAKKTMTEPGYSEHHTGLSLDVVDESWNKNYVGGVLDARFGDQPGAKWLAEHAATYGFIIRYPKNQEKITAITYEPWHIRYVGKESAEYIQKNQLTLEEYLNLLP